MNVFLRERIAAVVVQLELRQSIEILISEGDTLQKPVSRLTQMESLTLTQMESLTLSANTYLVFTQVKLGWAANLAVISPCYADIGAVLHSTLTGVAVLLPAGSSLMPGRIDDLTCTLNTKAEASSAFAHSP